MGPRHDTRRRLNVKRDSKEAFFVAYKLRATLFWTKWMDLEVEEFMRIRVD